MKLDKYIPEKKDSLVQARVPETLKSEVQALLDQKGWTWGDFITAAMKSFLDQNQDDTLPSKEIS